MELDWEWDPHLGWMIGTGMQEQLEEIARRVDRVIEHADKVAPEKLQRLEAALRKLNELPVK